MGDDDDEDDDDGFGQPASCPAGDFSASLPREDLKSKLDGLKSRSDSRNCKSSVGSCDRIKRLCSHQLYRCGEESSTDACESEVYCNCQALLEQCQSSLESRCGRTYSTTIEPLPGDLAGGCLVAPSSTRGSGMVAGLLALLAGLALLGRRRRK